MNLRARRLISCVRYGPARLGPGEDEPQPGNHGRLFLACEHRPQLAGVKLVPSHRALTALPLQAL